MVVADADVDHRFAALGWVEVCRDPAIVRRFQSKLQHQIRLGAKKQKLLAWHYIPVHGNQCNNNNNNNDDAGRLSWGTPCPT